MATLTLQGESPATTAKGLVMDLGEVLEGVILAHLSQMLPLDASLVLHWIAPQEGLWTAIGPHLVPGLGMALESLVLVVCHLPGMRAGFPITTCGEIGWTFQTTTTEGGPSLTGRWIWIGVTEIEEGRASSTTGNHLRGDHHPRFHHRHHLTVAGGHVMLGREVGRQLEVAHHQKTTAGMSTWNGDEMIGEAWVEIALVVHIDTGVSSSRHSFVCVGCLYFS